MFNYFELGLLLNKNNMKNNKIKCSFCVHLNDPDDFNCVGMVSDVDICGAPLDLDIEYETFNGLPNIIQKK